MIGHPVKVSQLIEEIDRGQVVLPEIQRAYVWHGPQVARLLDSLYRDYPSGQILLWDTADLPVIRHLDGVGEPALPSVGQPKVVLDGQQRLTSLYKALGDADADVNVYFNLDSEQFQRYQRRLKADPRWVSVRDVVRGVRHDLDVLDDIESAGLLQRKDPLRKQYADRLARLRRIADYKFPIEIFKSDDYEEVTELFVRINSAGTRLRSAELALAQLALRLPGTLVEQFESALEEYGAAGYELDGRFLTRAFIAIGTGQSRFRYLKEFWKKEPKQLQAIWRSTRKAVDCAVNFARQNAHFESSDWLPSLNILIPLAAYFDVHPKLAPAVEDDLLRWFFVASLRGRYSGSAETSMDEDLRAVRDKNPALQLLKNAAPISQMMQVSPDELDDAGSKNPLFALAYAAARRNGAKDWFTGLSLSKHVVGTDHEIEIHHIFAKALLNQAAVRPKDRDEIANLAFLTARPNKQVSSQPPSEYLPQILAKHKDRLIAQSIPIDERLWNLDRFDEFLTKRRELLAASITELIADPR